MPWVKLDYLNNKSIENGTFPRVKEGDTILWPQCCHGNFFFFLKKKITVKLILHEYKLKNDDFSFLKMRK